MGLDERGRNVGRWWRRLWRAWLPGAAAALLLCGLAAAKSQEGETLKDPKPLTGAELVEYLQARTAEAEARATHLDRLAETLEWMLKMEQAGVRLRELQAGTAKASVTAQQRAAELAEKVKAATGGREGCSVGDDGAVTCGGEAGL